MKKMIFLVLLMLILPGALLAQNNPLYILDGQEAHGSVMQLIKPDDISEITVLKDATATAIYGSRAVHGVIIITSKEYAKNKYWEFFADKSSKYKAVVPSPNDDSDVVYIVNGKVDNSEAMLYKMTRGFEKLEVIKAKKLRKEYKIMGKKYGVVISGNTDIH